METLIDKIERFVAIGYGDGSGYGYGYGYGYGSGDGYGDGSGDGYGYGYGYGSGDGSGYGYGSGYGDGIKEIAGHRVYKIDDTPTVIYSVRGNIAKGATIRNNTELVPCYIVREGDAFAHGATLREAFDAVQEKAYDNTPVEERISAFCEAHDRATRYPARELYKWHHILTGSCRFGRDEFVKAHCIDLDNGKYTVAEFIALCENSYGGETIKRLREYYG